MRNNEKMLDNYIQQQNEAIKRLNSLNKSTDEFILKLKILGRDD